MWICNKCGTENGDENEKCLNCGESYEETETEILDETVVIPPWFCPTCGAECSEAICPFCLTEMPAPEETEAEAQKKSNKGLVIALAALVIVIVLVTAGIFVYHFMRPQERVLGEDLLTAKDKISDDSIALIINDIEVPTDIFEIQLYQMSLVHIEDYIDAGNDIADFKWDDKDEETGKTRKEAVLAETYETLVELYAIMSMGEEHKTKATKDEIAEIETSIEQMREYYGDDFEEMLKLYGYNSIKQYEDYMKLNINAQAIVADIQDNMERYMDEDTDIYKETKNEPTAISAKHILISVDEANGIDDATAKKTAEDILKKIKNGEDFDKLMKEYNTDSGEPDEGYTFGKGQMVEEFENAAFALKIDEVSEVVKSEFGYHIIKRCLSYVDIINYENMNAKVLINTDLIKSMKIDLDYTEMNKKLEEIQTRIIERLMAQQVMESVESGEASE